MDKVQTRRARRIAAVAAAVLVVGAAPASAAVSIAGDSSWQVRAEADTNVSTVAVNGTVKGTASVKYTAHVLGIPVPVKGYYVNSFPYVPLKAAVLQSSNADLSSTSYKQYYNTYLGAYSWEVRGSSSFWGDKSVTIVGTAKGDIKGTSGFFLAGTYPCGSSCTNANAYTRVSVN